MKNKQVKNLLNNSNFRLKYLIGGNEKEQGIKLKEIKNKEGRNYNNLIIQEICPL